MLTRTVVAKPRRGSKGPVLRRLLNVVDHKLRAVTQPLHDEIDKQAPRRAQRLKVLGGTYRLVPLSAYRAEQGLSTTILERPSLAGWAGPKFAGDPDEAPAVPSRVLVMQPALEITELPGVMPLAASNIALIGRDAIHADGFSPARDVCMAERYHYIRINPRRGELYHHPAKSPVRMPPAVSLFGQSAGNYAHFLTEVLPRLLVVDELDRYAKMPLLVDGWMHHNHLHLIRLLNRRHRSIIRCGIGQPPLPYFTVEVSPTAYAPPEYRSFVEHGKVEFTPAEDYRFNVTALNMVRDEALKKRPRSSEYGSRILLARRTEAYGNGRHVLNMAPIIRTALKAGFQVVDPSSLSVKDQIRVFRNARIVISPIGAALANLTFTPPGCRVICLSGVFPGANYYYFSNLMAALGHEMTYVIGPQKVAKGRHPFHHDYTVDLDAFRYHLQSVLSH